MTEEQQRMLSGEWYYPGDHKLVAAQRRARRLLRKFNNGSWFERNLSWVPILAGISHKGHHAILKQLLGSLGEGANVEGLFSCDYGYNIYIGHNSGINHGCVLLDCGRITIGDNTLIGPGVHIYAVDHPVDHDQRRGGNGRRNCRAVPVMIGNDVWIGGGSRILPGVKIGDGAIVGAGSVVKHDVAPFTTVAGSPASLKKQVQQNA